MYNKEFLPKKAVKLVSVFFILTYTNMFDEILNEENLDNCYVEEELKIIKEQSSHIFSEKVENSSSLMVKYVEDEGKDSIYMGGRYVLSHNIEFLCKIIQNLANLSATIIFIPKKDHLMICTHNSSTSLFSRTTFNSDFFIEIDTSCLVEKDHGCCISSQSVNTIFRIPNEIQEDINYFTINADPSKDFMDIMLFGPGTVSELIKVNQLTFTNPIDDYLFLHNTEDFCLVSHIDLWDSLFKRSSNTLSEIILEMKKNSVIIKLRKQNTGVVSNFNIEIKAENFIKYNTKTEFILSFSYREFVMACNIITKLSKMFVLEYVNGEAPLKMTVYDSNIVDFEIFFPCNLESQ
ncbi:Rad9/Ddc1 family-containing protein [Strongyloides ratti]|uniref:Rad9/Ddc1 family-containing protein n=1 Tax=Strongyloides ratti TaxID=34506 RepID=A0A090MX93_STRRB|nr:Rad9/Ddc1 family-containing protein [Strongyloides ratti]CEF65034.1 Rad9/Ddc1 family-containing protein [Strongyloides ratti]